MIFSKSKVNLFLSLYNEENETRLAELIFCIEKNILNIDIQRIFVLNEGLVHPVLSNEKIQLIEFKNRPKYSDFFTYLVDDEINIIINSDIYFGNGLSRIKYLIPKERKVFVLTRFETTGKLFNSKGNSHDCWIFYGKPLTLKLCDFTLGIPNCEQRLAAVLSDNDYYILNPSKFIKSYHVHSSNKRDYLINGQSYSGVGLLIKPLGFIGTWFLFVVLRYLRLNNLYRRRTYNADGSIYDKW